MAPPPKVSAMVPSRTPPPTQVNARVPSGAPPPQVNARAQVPSGAPPKVSVPVPVPKSCGSSAKSTPIKSPELKKSKMEVVNSSAKNLAHDFDSVATTVSADSQPVPWPNPTNRRRIPSIDVPHVPPTGRCCPAPLSFAALRLRVI